MQSDQILRIQMAEKSFKRPMKKHRWYLGGIASAGAAAFTHPLDLLKVSEPSFAL